MNNLRLNSTDVIVFVFAGVVLLALLFGFIIYFIYTYQKRQQRNLSEKNLLKEEFKRTLLRTQVEIYEQTLKNISQEIHDNIGQTLSLAKLNLNTIDLQKQNAENKIVHSKELVSKAIQDLRNLSKSLNTDSILSSGLTKAIETELTIVDHAGVFKTAFETAGQPIGIDPKKELILFRIVQEAINNIIKHSAANNILVDLDFANEYLKIQVTDNGKGFETNLPGSEGQGLCNMKSRAELIGGNFNVTSNSNGTTITITLPITAS